MSRRRPDPEGKIALPITPMLDMTFQLLFFFIMNFNRGRAAVPTSLKKSSSCCSSSS